MNKTSIKAACSKKPDKKMKNLEQDVISIVGERSKFPKSLTFETPILKLAVCPLNIHNFKFKWSIVRRQTENKPAKLL